MSGMIVAAGIGAATSIIGGIIGNKKAKKQARAAAAEKKRLERKINAFEQNRQDVINPYSDVRSLAGLATDLSSEMSNPYANLPFRALCLADEEGAQRRACRPAVWPREPAVVRAMLASAERMYAWACSVEGSGSGAK